MDWVYVGLNLYCLPDLRCYRYRPIDQGFFEQMVNVVDGSIFVIVKVLPLLGNTGHLMYVICHGLLI